MKKKYLVVFALSNLLLQNTGFSQANPEGPSFNCEKASRPIEKLICSDSVLSELDLNMSNTYKATLANASQPDLLRKDQINWQKNERNLCKDRDCLIETDISRIEFLKSYNANIAELEQKSTEVLSQIEGTEQTQQLTTQSEYFNLESSSPPNVKSENLEQTVDAEDSKNPLSISSENIQNNNNEEKLPTNAELNHKNFFSNIENLNLIIILISILALITIYLIYRLISKIKRSTKINQLNSIYKSTAAGKFCNDQAVIEAHKSIFKVNEQTQVTIKKIILTFSKVKINASLRWSASVGVVDQGSWSQAVGSYQIAKSQWDTAKTQHRREMDIAKARHSQQYELAYNKWVNAGQRGIPPSRGYLAETSFNAPAPKAPDEARFVQYHRESGEFEGQYDSENFLPFFVFTDPLLSGSKLTDELVSFYSGILNQISSGEIENITQPPHEEYDEITLKNDEVIESALSSGIEKSFLKQAIDRAPKGKYIKDVSYDILDRNLTRLDIFLPVFLAKSRTNNKVFLSIHDHIDPSFTIFKKLQ